MGQTFAPGNRVRLRADEREGLVIAFHPGAGGGVDDLVTVGFLDGSGGGVLVADDLELLDVGEPPLPPTGPQVTHERLGLVTVIQSHDDGEHTVLTEGGEVVKLPLQLPESEQ